MNVSMYLCVYIYFSFALEGRLTLGFLYQKNPPLAGVYGPKAEAGKIQLIVPEFGTV